MATVDGSCPLLTQLLWGRIIIEGPPGVGKTTLVRRIQDELAAVGASVLGYYKEEVRDPESDEHIGFDVVSFTDGSRAALARIGTVAMSDDGRGEGQQQQQQDGRYLVDWASFEGLAIRSLSAAESAPRGKTVVVMDEVSSMEARSSSFVVCMRQQFGLGYSGVWSRGPPRHPVIATVSSCQESGVEFMKNLQLVPGVLVVKLTEENRDEMAASLVQQLKDRLALLARCYRAYLRTRVGYRA